MKSVVVSEWGNTRLQVSEVTVKGRALRFRETVICDIEPAGDFRVLSCEPLGIHLPCASVHHAYSVFADAFAMLWEEYALADDGALTKDAIALKTTLLDMVESA